MVRSAKWRALLNGITSSPSATSAAVRVITGPKAPSSTGGGPNGLGPGLKLGAMMVWVKNSPRKSMRHWPSHAAKIALIAATVSAIRAAGRSHLLP